MNTYEYELIGCDLDMMIDKDSGPYNNLDAYLKVVKKMLNQHSESPQQCVQLVLDLRELTNEIFSDSFFND